MVEGISQREFAKREGCTPKLVRNKLAQGYLKALPDGTLDPTLVGTDWRARTYKPRAKVSDLELSDEPEINLDADTDLADLEQVSDSARLMLSNGFVMLTEAEAKRKKENYLALRQELLFDKESGKVVLVDDITTEIAEQLGRVRALLLGIPSKVAAQIIGTTSIEDARDLMMREITLALGEIERAAAAI